jgi:hypothetical protein
MTEVSDPGLALMTVEITTTIDGQKKTIAIGGPRDQANAVASRIAEKMNVPLPDHKLLRLELEAKDFLVLKPIIDGCSDIGWCFVDRGKTPYNDYTIVMTDTTLDVLNATSDRPRSADWSFHYVQTTVELAVEQGWIPPSPDLLPAGETAVLVVNNINLEIDAATRRINVTVPGEDFSNVNAEINVIIRWRKGEAATQAVPKILVDKELH